MKNKEFFETLALKLKEFSQNDMLFPQFRPESFNGKIETKEEENENCKRLTVNYVNNDFKYFITETFLNEIDSEEDVYGRLITNLLFQLFFAEGSISNDKAMPMDLLLMGSKWKEDAIEKKQLGISNYKD